ncbi:MAG: PilW family protein [Thiotrichaceae bacterium]|nr:PilW family protein [Thiotrichaceae bacterium]
MKKIHLTKGFSLIELMIAIVIGLMLTLGTATLYTSSYKSTSDRGEYEKIEDNGRLALEVLTNIIEHAGYTSTNANLLQEKFIRNDTATAQVVSINCGGVNNIVNTNVFTGLTTEDDDLAGDSIGVIFVGDANLNTDCAGGVLPLACQAGGVGSMGASRVYNHFSIGNNIDGLPVLNCAGSRTNTTVEIAEGVENLQILYGIDSNADNQVGKYVTSDNVSDWSQVITVQLAILVRSEKPVFKTDEQRFYTLLHTEYSRDDRFQRAVFSTTIRLRNIQQLN